jgi:predicted RNase H-like nuclease (RuvC/YqgF family)
MEKNDQNRNFTISSKVSSSQKAKYIQEAERLNLSLSEWMCGTLDMSIKAYEDVNKLSEIKALQEEICEKDKKIRSLSSRLEIFRLCLDSKKDKVLRQAETISKLENLIQKLQTRLDNCRETIYRG